MESTNSSNPSQLFNINHNQTEQNIKDLKLIKVEPGIYRLKSQNNEALHTLNDLVTNLYNQVIAQEKTGTLARTSKLRSLSEIVKKLREFESQRDLDLSASSTDSFIFESRNFFSRQKESVKYKLEEMEAKIQQYESYQYISMKDAEEFTYQNDPAYASATTPLYSTLGSLGSIIHENLKNEVLELERLLAKHDTKPEDCNAANKRIKLTSDALKTIARANKDYDQISIDFKTIDSIDKLLATQSDVIEFINKLNS